MNEYQILLEKFKKAQDDLEVAKKELNKFYSLSVLPKEKLDIAISLCREYAIASDNESAARELNEEKHHEFNEYCLNLEKEYGLGYWEIVENLYSIVDKEMNNIEENLNVEKEPNA